MLTCGRWRAAIRNDNRGGRARPDNRIAISRFDFYIDFAVFFIYIIGFRCYGEPAVTVCVDGNRAPLLSDRLP